MDLILWLLWELANAWLPREGTPGPSPPPLSCQPSAVPTVGEDRSYGVEGGRIRIWSRRRPRHGDVVRMIEFRSELGRFPAFRAQVEEGSLHGNAPDQAQARIRQIAALYSGILYVECDGLMLVVRACGEPRGTDTDAFRAECLRLLRDLGETTGRLVRSEGTCPVCKEEAPADPACTFCRTPHHRDCWRYAGHCSVFGCRGRELG